LLIDKGKGMWVDDPDGNTFLDFTSGIAVCNTGHCHPEVVEAAKDQLDRLIHTCGADFYHAPMIEVAEELAAIAPGKSKKRIFLGNSGAEAVEAGFKLARWHSGLQNALAFSGAFHGRTMGALTLTASKAVQKRKFVTNRHTKKHNKKIRDLMLRKCFENGLLLLSGGDSTIRFCPPLITTSEQIEVGLEIFSDVLKTVAG